MVDVFMRLVHDGPAYALVLLVCVMVLKGQATAAEALISGALALLSRSMPPQVKIPSIGGALLFVLLMGTVGGCKSLPPTEPPFVEAGPGGASCSGVWAKDPTLGVICVAVEDIAPFLPLIMERKRCLDGGCLDASK